MKRTKIRQKIRSNEIQSSREKEHYQFNKELRGREGEEEKERERKREREQKIW
jgi:hypothetical protein